MHSVYSSVFAHDVPLRLRTDGLPAAAAAELSDEKGKEDPTVQLIKVVPHGAEYWANGNAIASAVKMTAAAVTDTAIEKSLGENFSIEL